jgi:CRISPR system Cascade subunit CasD
MTGWLLIVLAAPLASFGEDPGNARRGTADRPTRSALIGLAGAALGAERADSIGQKALADSLLTATRTVRPGLPLTDFHTFQSLPAGKEPTATRAHALALSGDLETSITRRDYRADGLVQAAYCATSEATVSLEALRDAFLRPRFLLWAGRKSCPLAHPLVPLLIGSDDIESAFAEHACLVDAKDGAAFLGGRATLAVDDRLGPLAGDRPARLHRRNDDPGDRSRWHFSSRGERVYAMPPINKNKGDGP